MLEEQNQAMSQPQRLDRRGLFRTAGLGAGALALGAVATGVTVGAHDAEASNVPDADILNFALNLEYLEAEYYLRAVTGTGLDASEVTGVGNQGSVTGGYQVQFSTAALQQYAEEIAQDEHAHVLFLRAALGDAAIAEPTIDLVNSFNNAAIAAGLITSGQTFDPFASEANFLLGAFIFEDVGVTAYHGAAPLIKSRAYLSAAAGILGTEAYHASEIRVLILQNGLAEAANAISKARAALGGGKDQGPTRGGVANIVPADKNSIVFARTTDEVKNIVYLGGAANNNGFFPNLLNGNIS